MNPEKTVRAALVDPEEKGLRIGTSGVEMPYDITCGYFDCGKFAGMAVSPKRRAERFEIEYYTCDAGNTMLDDKTYPIMADHVLISKVGQMRYSQLPFKTIFLKFCVDGQLAELLKEMPEYFRVWHTGSVKDLLKNIILYSEVWEEKKLLVYGEILSLINLLKEDSTISVEENSIRHDIAKKAQRFMEAHLHEKITLSDMAETVGLSNTYFHTLFRAATGMTPHDYLVQCRVNAAKEILWDSSVSMSEVAERCGFGCQQYLNNVFKNVTGLSPGQYRKECLRRYDL